MIKFNFNCEVHAENILEAFTKLGLNPFQANGEGVKITCENIELQGAGAGLDVPNETSSKKGQTRGKKENVAAPEVKPEPKPEPKAETAPIESTKTLDDVRAALSIAVGGGYEVEAKAILEKFGASKLSEVKVTDYESVITELEAVG